MAELIETLLALPRSEKLKLIAFLAQNLQEDEPEVLSEDIALAKELDELIRNGKMKLHSEDAYWQSVRAHKDAHS